MEHDEAFEKNQEQARLSDRPTVTRGVAQEEAEQLEASPRPPLSSVPSMIDGRYIVERVLGEGTAGVVYLCRHMVIEKMVAIKVLRNDLAQDDHAHDRFANEARAATAIGSEHIVETLDFGHTEDGSTYIVMEYLEGETLGDLLLRETLLEFERVVRLMRQITKGLGAAHAAGIVHRDVKPDNMFIIRHGQQEFIKILDFGVAKMASAQGALTRAGTIFGTPHYMSPEQAAGQSADQRADIYSVGVMLHELAAGVVPFDAEAPLGILSQHMQNEPPRLRDVVPEGRELPEGYEAIVLKCLSKEPEERYASMAELDAELEGLERGLAPQAVEEMAERERLASLHPTAPPKKSSAPYWVLAAALIGAGSFWLYQNSAELDAPEKTAVLGTVSVAPPTPVVPPMPTEAESEPEGTQVDLVLFPLNARVYKDDEDLGPMPVSVFVPEGQTVNVMVKHRGYISRKLKLDGSKSRVVVGLKHWTESEWGKKKLAAEKRQEEQQEKAVRPASKKAQKE